jgi:hypothetical protein
MKAIMIDKCKIEIAPKRSEIDTKHSFVGKWQKMVECVLGFLKHKATITHNEKSKT